jgi:hypothetical protein
MNALAADHILSPLFVTESPTQNTLEVDSLACLFQPWEYYPRHVVVLLYTWADESDRLH